MKLRVEMPPTLAGSGEARLQQLYGYLFRMAEQLNVAIDGTEAANTAAVTVNEGTAGSAKDNRDELRQLILQTAELLRNEMNKLESALRGQYTVMSDRWDTCRGETEAAAAEAAEAAVERYGLIDSVDTLQGQATDIARYHKQMQNNIRQGFFERDSSGRPVLGVLVGQGLTGTEITSNGQTVTEVNEAQTCVFYTGDRVSFRIHGREIAYVFNGRLYASDAEVTEHLTLGQWMLEDHDGLTVKYIG